MSFVLSTEALAWIVAFMTIYSVLQIPFPNKKFNFQRVLVTPEFRRQRKDFLIGFPIGILLGVLTHLPFVGDIFKWHQEWYYPFIQAEPLIFYVGILTIVTGFRIITTLFPIKTSERKSLGDGIFYAFIMVQIVLFFLGYVEIFFPTLNPQFHHGIVFPDNSTNK